MEQKKSLDQTLSEIIFGIPHEDLYTGQRETIIEVKNAVLNTLLEEDSSMQGLDGLVVDDIKRALFGR